MKKQPLTLVGVVLLGSKGGKGGGPKLELGGGTELMVGGKGGRNSGSREVGIMYNVSQKEH